MDPLAVSIPNQKPKWLRKKLSPQGLSLEVQSVIARGGLYTVCAEAQCPNQMECFSRGEATFLLLGPSCTRNCTFCAVDRSKVMSPNPCEPERTARAVYDNELY